MSPRQLIEKLESLGTIDPKIMYKICREIDNPEKTVKPKAVLAYLVKKKQITEQQARQLLKAPKLTEDAITAVPSVEKSYDTDDLTGLIQEEHVISVTPEPEVPEVSVDPIPTYDATMIDDGGLARQVDPDLVISAELDPEPLLDEAIHEVAPVDYGGLGDEADGGFDPGGFDSGGYAAPPSG